MTKKKINENLQFGRLALFKGFINENQLSNALNVQRVRNQRKDKIKLGRLMVSLSYLTPRQVNQLLLWQVELRAKQQGLASLSRESIIVSKRKLINPVSEDSDTKLVPDEVIRKIIKQYTPKSTRSILEKRKSQPDKQRHPRQRVDNPVSDSTDHFPLSPEHLF